MVDGAALARRQLDAPPDAYYSLKNAYGNGSASGVREAADIASATCIIATTALLVGCFGMQNHLAKQWSHEVTYPFPKPEEPLVAWPVKVPMRPYAYAMAGLMEEKYNMPAGRLMQYGIQILSAMHGDPSKTREWQISHGGRNVFPRLSTLFAATDPEIKAIPYIDPTPSRPLDHIL